MFCRRCGKPLSPDQFFCTNCGAAVNQNPDTTPSPNHEAAGTAAPAGVPQATSNPQPLQTAGGSRTIIIVAIIAAITLIGAACILAAGANSNDTAPGTAATQAGQDDGASDISNADSEAEDAQADASSAHKATIEQNAQDFLRYLYDTQDNNRMSRDDWFTLTNQRSLQSGWPATRAVEFEWLEAVDEDTVEYELTYESTGGSGSSEWLPDRQSSYGTIVFDANGNIDSWYPDGMTKNRLIG